MLEIRRIELILYPFAFILLDVGCSRANFPVLILMTLRLAPSCSLASKSYSIRRSSGLKSHGDDGDPENASCTVNRAD
jgi:hypothetical protein